jgi:membrane fusion protein (multidrug efflux system)
MRTMIRFAAGRLSRAVTAAALVAVAGTALALAGCSPSDGGAANAQQTGRGDTTGVRVINVGVTPVARSTFVDYVRIVGEVAAMQDVTLSAEESGTISRFLVEKGARVAAGDVLAKIDDAVLQAQVDEARAMAEIAREEYERRRRLWEEDRVGSEIAYLQTKSGSEAANARYRTLQARLDRTELRAPVSGIFDEKYVEVGELVAPGTRVARVVATAQVKITGGVPERYALEVRRGDSAIVTLDVLPDRTFVGKIRFVGASVDPDNRTVPVELVLDNPGGVLKPQMVANVQVTRARLQDVVVVPQELVQRTENGYQVFVTGDRDGRAVAVARPVELGPSQENRVVIRSGLGDGDVLITTGYRMVDDGSLVRVVEGGEGR